MNNEDPKTQKIVYSGIMAAVSAVLGLMAVLLPFNSLILLFAMSVVMCLVVQKEGAWWGLWTFGVTTVIMFLVSAVHTVPVAYAILFGTYPIAKFIIEKKQPDRKKELIIKIVWWVLITAVLVWIADRFIGGETFWGEWYSKLKIAPLVVILILLPAEWLYDVVLTYVLYFINRRFRFR